MRPLRIILLIDMTKRLMSFQEALGIMTPDTQAYKTVAIAVAGLEEKLRNVVIQYS